MNSLKMATSLSWRLKRYSRLASADTGNERWKVFEADGNGSEIVLTIVEYGYFIVIRGKESLDTIPLMFASEFLKVQQRKDNLMLRYTVKGESRLLRMQFDGRNKAEAVKECSSAVETLREYLAVSNQDDAPLPPNQPPTDACTPLIQGTAVGAEPQVVQGSLSIKHLAKHFLGETDLALPQFYHYGSLEEQHLEPFMRVCLLDPSFPGFVEKVEGELKKLLEE